MHKIMVSLLLITCLTMEAAGAARAKRQHPDRGALVGGQGPSAQRQVPVAPDLQLIPATNAPLNNTAGAGAGAGGPPVTRRGGDRQGASRVDTPQAPRAAPSVRIIKIEDRGGGAGTIGSVNNGAGAAELRSSREYCAAIYQKQLQQGGKYEEDHKALFEALGGLEKSVSAFSDRLARIEHDIQAIKAGQEHQGAGAVTASQKLVYAPEKPGRDRCARITESVLSMLAGVVIAQFLG